jgi:hypothetical protein
MRYELDSYILFRRNPVFKRLKTLTWEFHAELTMITVIMQISIPQNVPVTEFGRSWSFIVHLDFSLRYLRREVVGRVTDEQELSAAFISGLKSVFVRVVQHTKGENPVATGQYRQWRGKYY